MSRPKRMPGRRKMTWVVLVFNVLMLVWIIGGASSALLAVLWTFGDVILGVLWLVTRSSKHDAAGARVAMATDAATSAVAPRGGWYADPERAAQQRYRDGLSWKDQRRT